MSSAGSKAGTSLLSTDLQKETPIGFPRSPPSWSIQRSTSSFRAGGTAGAQAAKKATGTIPIVFTSSGDPVATGLVASLARPGGNLTGLSGVGPDLSVKKVELLKEIMPKISRVAFIWNPGNAANELALRETEAAAREVRWQVQSVEVRGPARV